MPDCELRGLFYMKYGVLVQLSQIIFETWLQLRTPAFRIAIYRWIFDSGSENLLTIRLSWVKANPLKRADAGSVWIVIVWCLTLQLNVAVNIFSCVFQTLEHSIWLCSLVIFGADTLCTWGSKYAESIFGLCLWRSISEHEPIKSVLNWNVSKSSSRWMRR